jgi:hypothetical protein
LGEEQGPNMKRFSIFDCRTLSGLAASVALALTFGVGTASAESISFFLTTGNLAGYTGPYAQVTVDRTSSTTATITFTSWNDGAYIYLMGDGGSVALNVNATTFTATNISGTNSLTGSWTPGPYTTGSGNEDGLGSYNLKINSFDGWSHSANEITFTLTDTSGTWASVADVLTANSKGYVAAIHFFPCIPSGTGCDPNSPGAKAVNGNAGTGYAAGSGGVLATVPIPAAAWLFGSGLIGLIVIARRRRP